jgi:hypothetical protein
LSASTLIAIQLDTLQHLGSDDPLADVGGCQLKGDRHAVRCAQQVQPKAPEVAAVRCAPAIAGLARQVAAARGLARLAARHRGAVKQPQPVTKRRRVGRQVGEHPGDRRSQGTHALVVAGLLGQIGKQVSQSPAGQREELAVVRNREKHLRDSQRDELTIGDLLRTARTLPRRQEIVNTHVKCDDEGVEVGVHEASLVDVALSNASFGALVMSPCGHTPRSNTDSTI